MKEYSLYWTFTTRLLIQGVPLLMLAAGGVLVYVTISEDDPGALVFMLVWTALVIVAVFYWWRIPTSIELTEDGRVHFRGWMRHFEVAASDIESIKPGANNLGFLEVRTKRGKITILNQFDGFHDFLFRLRHLNPTVELRGC